MNSLSNKKYVLLFLFAFTFLLYARTINYGFVWDDERIHITGNEQLMKGNVSYFWEKPYKGMYIPVSYTAWTGLEKLASSGSKISPKFFHFVNVFTHGINGVLVFLLLLHLFKQQSYAFWGSLLFILHPLQVEPVVWVSEFRGLLSTFFMLSSTLALFLLIEKQNKISIKSLLLSSSFFLASIFYVLAMLSKPSAVVLPFIVGILAWVFYKPDFKIIALSLSLWLLICLPILYITKHSQPNESIYAATTLWQRSIIMGNVFLTYFLKLLLPYPLVACYGNTPVTILNKNFSIIALVIVLCIFIFLFINRNRYRMLFAGFIIIVICILPVSGIVPFEYQKHASTADRYMYFAIIGVTLWVPALTNWGEQYKWVRYALISLLVFYTVLNTLQVPIWKNEFALWDHTLNFYQNSSKIYYNRGVEYSKMKNYRAAVADYSKSIELDPHYLDALFNRANAYENLKDAKNAFIDYNTYLSIDSSDGSVYFKRAYLFYRTGHFAEAKTDVKKAEEHHFNVDLRFKTALNKASN